jgi:hypothetical protein
LPERFVDMNFQKKVNFFSGLLRSFIFKNKVHTKSEFASRQFRRSPLVPQKPNAEQQAQNIPKKHTYIQGTFGCAALTPLNPQKPILIWDFQKDWAVV